MKKLLHHTRRPDISFSRDGLIRITSRVANAISLRPGDCINISCSPDGEFLLHAVRIDNPCGRYQARCRPSRRGSSNLCVNSAALACSLLDAAGLHMPSASFAVGAPLVDGGVTYIPIITRQPLSNRSELS